MAKRTALGYTGLVGTVVLYEINGKQYMRSRPVSRNAKTNKATTARRELFGKVSKYGSSLIKAMKGKVLFPFSLGTYNAVRGWMRNEYAAHEETEPWPLVAKNNQMSQLNPETDLRNFLEVNLSVKDEGSGVVSITVPAMNPARNVKAPMRTVKINMKMMVLSRPFRESLVTEFLHMQSYTFMYKNKMLPEKVFSIDTEPVEGIATGNIALVAIALEFETTDLGPGIYNTEKRWLPAAIIAMGKLT